MNPDKTLFLLDAYALIYRSYYAFIRNPIMNSKGFNTSTIFGFVNTLDEILKKENPTHIGVVFDTSAPTFRNELFPAYKANRHETPEDISIAIPWIKKIIEAYRIPILELDGFEADDVIGTLAKKAEQAGYTVYMMTPDKDYGQLVSDNIFMYVPRKSGTDIEKWGPKEIQEKFLIDNPCQVADVLALWGDASDNVPGVPGIGEVTAKKLISEYKSVENLYENLGNLKGKLKENLENSRELVILAKKLVTIDLNVPIEFDPLKLIRDEYDLETIKTLYKELEFKTLLARHIPPVSIPVQPSGLIQGDLFSGMITQHQVIESGFETINSQKKEYHLIQTETEIEDLAAKIMKKGIFCFDTETTDLEIHSAKLVGLAISFREHTGYYIPVPQDFKRGDNLLDPIVKLLNDESIVKVGQNLKFDIRMLMNYGIETKGIIFDTMVAHYLLQPEQRHNLNVLSEHYLNYKPVSIEELIGAKGKRQGNMKNVPIEKIKDYAAEDADITWQLYIILKKELEANGLLELAQKIEMPLIYVLADMEHSGVRIDTKALALYALQLQKEIIESEEKIFTYAGLRFNISSPRQLGEILFERMKISDGAKKTKTKQYSTGEDVLSTLSDKHEIVAEILNYRSLRKLLSTYIETLPKMISLKTGRIHTSYNQTVAATGRLSSNNPNLQNIPIREERGREIRKAFIPSDDENGLLISADYSQIELRLMAHLSGDANMIEAFRQNEDIHTATAAKIFNVPLSEVTRDMRSSAKTANFGIIYGISAFGLSQRMDINRTEARELIDGYFRSFPGVKKYMDESIRKAREEGCVYTIFGRRRHLPDIHSRNVNIRGMAERNAINAPIQGSAADVIKIAMINIHKRMKEAGLRSRMVLQVHDELVFDIDINEAEPLKKIIKTEMEEAVKLNVPLTIDMGEGHNWLEAH